MIAALWLAAGVTAAAPVFAPPLGTPLSCVTTETRTIDGKALSFGATRHVVLARDGAGFTAAVATDHVDQQAGEGIGAMFQAAMGAFAGRTIRFHLDATGTVTAVDDLDPLWDKLRSALGTLGTSADSGKHAAEIAAALGSLPEPQRMAMLGSMVAPLVAGDLILLQPGGDTSVAVRARPSVGAPVSLAGRQTISRDANGRLVVYVAANGDVPGNPGDPTHITVTRDTVVDPATGLVFARDETIVTTIGTMRSTSTSTMRLTLPVS